jgi:hypothetical protein
MQVHTGKSEGVREKMQGLQVGKNMVPHLCRTRRGVTTDNFFTRCELANLLLTKYMTVVGTLRKNKPEIPALLLTGKTKEVHSSILVYEHCITYTSKKKGCHPPFITTS